MEDMVDKMNLEELVNFQDLRLVLSDFTSACNLRISLYGIDNKAIIEGFSVDFPEKESTDNFFECIRRTTEEKRSTTGILKCSNGMNSFYIPIKNADDIIAYLISEPVFFNEETRDKYRDELVDKGIKKLSARTAAKQIPIFSAESFKAKLRFLETAFHNLVRSSVMNGELAEVNHLSKENEKLRFKAESKLKTLSTLFSISRTFNSSHNLNDVLQTVIQSVTKLLKVEICSIMLYDKNEDVLKIAAAHGIDSEIIRTAKVKIGSGLSGHVAKFRKSLLISDISKDPRFSTNKNKSDYKTRSALSVPIIRNENLIGVINVNNKFNEEIFTYDDQELLEAISDQTAVAVMNARHHENSIKKLRELQYLNNISQMVQSTLDLDKLLKVTLDLITELMGVETCSLMLIDELTQTMNIVIANGLDPDIIKNSIIKVGEGISGRVAETGEPMLIKNIEEDDRTRKKSSDDYKNRSALSVPLKVKEKIIGVINVNNKIDGNIFHDSDLQFLETLSSQISSAIENAKLYNQTQQKIVEMTMLQKVGQVINSTLDLSTVLELVIDQILNIFDADMGSLMLFDDESGTLRITEQKGINSEYAKDVRFKPGEGVAGTVYKTGISKLIRNSVNDEDYKKFGNRVDNEAKTLMCVPVFIKGNVEGVLSCEKRLDHTGSFNEENLDLMSTISSQASVAIENANLYNDLLDLYLHTIQSLAAAIDAKDSYTHGHSKRVMSYSIAIAEEMGFDEQELNTLRHTALLHDIGKIGISEAILQKPGKLTNEEFDYIKGHPVVGAHILESIEFLKDVRMQMKHHHEKYDGSGYPDGLKEDQIPIGARIISVADTYDAMTSTRPYRKGLEHEIAVKEIERCSGTQFDPHVVECFMKIADRVNEEEENLSIVDDPRFNPRIKLKQQMK